MMKKLLNSGIFWTFVIGFLGFGLTVFIFQLSNKKREPVFSIKKEASLIFDKENSTPKIKLLSNDSTVINQNVYVSNIVVWNNGELEIKKSDVRIPFKVGISNNAKILDYKIINETHPNISKFKAIFVENELLIDWDYFDPNFGFELQLIYSGIIESEIFVDGYVLGEKIKKVETKKSTTNIIFYLNIFNLLAYFILSYTSLKKYKAKNKEGFMWFLIPLSILIFYIFFVLFNFFEGFNIPL